MKLVLRKNKYPVKTNINLVQKGRRGRNRGFVLLAVTAVILGGMLFTRFAILAPLKAADDAQAMALRSEAALLELKGSTANYDVLLPQFEAERLTRSPLNGQANPLKCLALIEERLLPGAKISSFTIASPIITVRLSGVTLNQVSSLYQGLIASDMVSSVQVYTASTESDQTRMVTASMNIMLAVEEPAATASPQTSAGSSGEGATP